MPPAGRCRAALRTYSSPTHGRSARRTGSPRTERAQGTQSRACPWEKTSGALVAGAPAVAPCAAAPSFSCSTSSEGDSFYRSGDLLEEGRVAAEGADHRELQRLAEELVGDPHQVVCGDRIDLRHVLIDPLDSAGEGFLSAVPGRYGVGDLHLQQ